MAITVVASGTQAATVNTEHTLATDTSGGVRVLAGDLGNLAYGDTVELRLYTKVLSGSTERQAYVATFSHVQGSPNVYSVPVPTNISCKATLKQTGGTGRSFDWALLGV